MRQVSSVAWPVALLLLLSLPACGSGGPPGSGAGTPPDVAVLAAALRAELPRKAGFVVVLEPGGALPELDGQDLARLLPAAPPEALAAFRERNREPARTPQGLAGALDLPLRTVSRAELEALFTDGGWDAFQNRFPGAGGYFRLTLPGYTAGARRAVVHLSWTCGGLCGHGKLLLLEQDTEGRWRVSASAVTWIS